MCVCSQPHHILGQNVVRLLAVQALAGLSRNRQMLQIIQTMQLDRTLVDIASKLQGHGKVKMRTI
jgi:hypothetical protein